MTVALAGLLVVYECRAIIGPFLQEDRIRAEKIMKNVILLVSLLMLIDAIYVPKGWRRAAIVSSSLALLPLATLAGAYLLHPESVRWVGEPRADGNKPLAVFGVDTVFLLTLAAHLVVRGPHDLAAEVAGRRGATVRPIPSRRADRSGRDG